MGERQDPPGGGLGPPPYKNKFLNFQQYNQKYVKIKPRVTGFVSGGWWGVRFEREARAMGVWGRSPQKKLPAGRLATAIVQHVLQNYRMLWMDMECNSIAC